jgi:hypothetical protein
MPWTSNNWISREINDFIRRGVKMVFVLPIAQSGMLDRKRNRHDWTPGRDFRVICDCQRHRRRDAVRRKLQVVSRGIALLIGVPLAFGALGIPMEAMDVVQPHMSERMRARVSSMTRTPLRQTQKTLPLITEQVREQFLFPQPSQKLSLELTKEHYFRTHVPFGAIIYEEARKNGLSPELVAAVVESESNFRPRLISEKNAQGLMQIIPSTSRLLGVGDPFDPQENIAAGTRYLKYLMNRFEDPRIALAAYNAGEGNVARFGGVPPFPETQTYLSRVSTRATIYRQRVRTAQMTSSRLRSATSLY